jgi:predicted DNA-binding transcriptional regulator AlpA
MEQTDLLDTEDVAALLGLSSRRSVSVYRSRYADFPAPHITRGRCVLWLRADIVDWRDRRS